MEFLNIKNNKELSEFFGISLKKFTYITKKLSVTEKYISFKIKKKNGNEREILSPIKGLKKIQKKLSIELLKYYQPKNCVFSYIKEKSIKNNAEFHLNKRHIVNIDIKNFFSAIHFGRVLGLFKTHPFNFNDKMAFELANICCYQKDKTNGFLPQGAPTSPIISNFICRGLDNKFIQFANNNKLRYSRYSDDITLSSNSDLLPESLGKFSNEKFVINPEIKELLNRNSFELNQKKVFYASKAKRQEVTGLVINEKVNIKRSYIKNVRGILHALEKFGKLKTAKKYFEINNIAIPEKENKLIKKFERILKGKILYIGRIRGWDDFIYKKFIDRFKKIFPDNTFKIDWIDEEINKWPKIHTEGKTDLIHLKNAYERLKKKLHLPNINIPDENEGKTEGDGKLFKKFKEGVFSNKEVLHLCIFDSDNQTIMKFIQNNWKNNFHHFSNNNVVGFILPENFHNHNKFSIEFLYRENDLKMKDSNDRRIFTTDEFSEDGYLIKDKNIFYNGENKNILKSKNKIIDSNVIDTRNNNSLALSKNDFADLIINKDNVDLSCFEPLFLKIKNVILEYKNNYNEKLTK